MSSESDDGCIYVFTNTKTGQRYVGQTWRIKKRLKEHATGRGYARLLKAAIEKFGMDSFTVKVMYHSTKQADLNKVERLFIQMFSTQTPYGYNIAAGGNNKGKHSEETKRLIGSYHKYKVMSEETRKKLSEALKGKKLEPARIEKLKITIAKNNEEKDRSVYFYDCITHVQNSHFKNMNDVKRSIDFPIERIYGSLSAKSRFKYNGTYCYASYNDIPSDTIYKFGRKVKILTEHGAEFSFQTLAEANRKMNLGRGVVDSLVRGVCKQSSFMSQDGEKIKFTAEYVNSE